MPRGELLMMVVVETELVTVETKMVMVETRLISRKAAIPVPGPIGGGSLSDWKEADDGKDGK